MNAETWVAIIAAMTAVVALYFSRKSAQAADRSARAAENQTKIQQQALTVAEEQTKLQQQAARAAEEQTKVQRQLRIDSAQPYVWADLRPDGAVGTLLNLVVGNSGPTFAENVRITVDRPLPSIDDTRIRERAEAAQARLQEGIRSLGPGRILMWPLGQAFNLLSGAGPLAYTFTVTADGPFGPIPPRTQVVDLSDLDGALDRPDGSLHELTNAVKDLVKKIGPRR